jgi:hypothetical protein
MKTFILLELYPTGNRQSGNKVLAEYTCLYEKDAINHFREIYPEINLDDFGYAREGNKSFTVSEEFNPIHY